MPRMREYRGHLGYVDRRASAEPDDAVVAVLLDELDALVKRSHRRFGHHVVVYSDVDAGVGEGLQHALDVAAFGHPGIGEDQYLGSA